MDQRDRQGDATPPHRTDAEWETRRSELSRQLAEQRGRIEPDYVPPDRSRSMQGAAEGLKIASEFVAGILVGAAIGYLIDSLAGTSPFGLIVFLMLGFVAGVLNVIRSVSGKGPNHGPDLPPGR